jgi:hypothetical protein
MREDGLEQWVMYWAEKNRGHPRAQNCIRRRSQVSHDGRIRLVQNTAILIIGASGVMAFLHILVAGIFR